MLLSNAPNGAVRKITFVVDVAGSAGVLPATGVGVNVLVALVTVVNSGTVCPRLAADRATASDRNAWSLTDIWALRFGSNVVSCAAICSSNSRRCCVSRACPHTSGVFAVTRP